MTPYDVQINGKTYTVTRHTWPQLYQLKLVERARVLGRPLTESEAEVLRRLFIGLASAHTSGSPVEAVDPNPSTFGLFARTVWGGTLGTVNAVVAGAESLNQAGKETPGAIRQMGNDLAMIGTVLVAAKVLKLW